MAYRAACRCTCSFCVLRVGLGEAAGVVRVRLNDVENRAVLEIIENSVGAIQPRSHEADPIVLHVLYLALFFVKLYLYG